MLGGEFFLNIYVCTPVSYLHVSRRLPPETHSNMMVALFGTALR